MKRIVLVALAGLAGLAGAASAQSGDAIAAGKAAGIVGERYDGYLGFAGTPTGALRQQAGAVNVTRRALYTRLATRRGVSPQEVGITAGCTTLARVRVGEPYMLGDGAWRRRAAGQPAPVPDYCG